MSLGCREGLFVLGERMDFMYFKFFFGLLFGCVYKVFLDKITILKEGVDLVF